MYNYDENVTFRNSEQAERVSIAVKLQTCT
jgi:hypothetical protein